MYFCKSLKRNFNGTVVLKSVELILSAIRKIISIILFLNICSTGYTQIIKGTILDQNTHNRIIFAAVYFNGTLVGTRTDQNGYFELDISKNLSMQLIISALGYYSVTLTDFIIDKPYLIYLEPKVFELKEVTIIGTANSAASKKFNIFKREFLGTTLNAKNCEINNKNDIKLIYSSDNDTLKAFSSNPIVINNKALGYKISYYLDKFEFCKTNNYLLLIGNYIFKEDSSIKNSQYQRFENRRKNAYLGSRMHFFRSLWENNLDSAGFMVRDSINRRLSYEKFVIQSDTLTVSDHAKYLKYHGNLSVTYYTKFFESRIEMVKEYVYFDRNGFFDPTGIRWDGDMARQRIGDLLPFEYKIN